MADQNQKDEEDQEELDPEVEENLENQVLSAQDGSPIGQNNIPPLTDEKNIPIADGAIPISSQGIAQGNYNAISPTGEVNIQFQQGNYQQLWSIPKIISDKVQVVTNTLIPLIEVACIELLGNSSMYRRDVGQCYPNIDENNQAFIDFVFKYTVDLWITQEIDQEAISADAQYVMNKLKMIPGASFSQCAIDCSDGSLTIVGRV